MIIFNKLDNYFVVSADSQTFLGFEMTANFRVTSSPLSVIGFVYLDRNPNFAKKKKKTCFGYDSYSAATVVNAFHNKRRLSQRIAKNTSIIR